MNDQAFSAEQQEYLKGFMAGVEAKRGPLVGAPPSQPADPADLQRAAQDRTVAEGGRLVPEEEAKRKKHPLDRFGEISALAEAGKFPKGTDVFLTKFHGLFYVAPAQNSFMCRLRMPGGILNSLQVRGIAAIAEELGGGFTDVTTRANLQIREIGAAAAPEVLTRLADLGLTSRGSGADNVRNVTGSPTAGIDAQELIDTRPDARRIHHHILNHRELYGLPRKFNIAFDGSGTIPVLEDTNDVAFTAVPVAEGFWGGTRRLLPPGTGRHHRPPGFRAPDRRDRDPGRDDARVRRDPARVHRERPPHRPHQGAAEIRAGRVGVRPLPGRR